MCLALKKTAIPAVTGLLSAIYSGNLQTSRTTFLKTLRAGS